MSLLEKLHPHARDKDIEFHQDTHEYIVRGQKYKASVSKVVHAYFPQFNAPEILDKCYPAWAYNKKSRYYQLITYIRLIVGITNDDDIKKEIAKSWAANGKDKADYGTAVHYLVELYLNDEMPESAPDDENKTQEFQQFLEWKQTHPTWIPYRTEWSIFHEDHGIAGQIDSVWLDQETGLYHMVDWKIVETLSQKHDYGEKGFPPFQDLPNTNLYHYTIQQNLYKYILETKYDFPISSMRLLQLHPTIDRAVEYPLVDIQDRMKEALETFVQTHLGHDEEQEEEEEEAEAMHVQSESPPPPPPSPT